MSGRNDGGRKLHDSCLAQLGIIGVVVAALLGLTKGARRG